MPFQRQRQIRFPLRDQGRMDIPAYSDLGSNDPAPLGQPVGIDALDRLTGMVAGPEDDFT
jgi:hypothetical protein